MLVTSIFSLFALTYLQFHRLLSSFQVYLNCCLHMLLAWTSLKFNYLVKRQKNTCNALRNTDDSHCKGDQTSFLVNFISIPHKPWFLRVCITSLLSLVTSNFSFSHSVFYPFGEHSIIFIKFEIVVYRLFQFGTA